MTETAIVNAVLVAVSARPGTMCWRNSTGALRDKNGRLVRFGLLGSADIIGCTHGRALAIECKSATGRLRQSQLRFRAAWEAAGGLYIVARSAADATAALDGLDA